MTPPDAVRMLGISRRFGSVQALHGADFVLARGEIHALLGENGAGKTTLMHVLYGMVLPDEGTLEIDGRPARPRSAHDALTLGIGLVHQHHAQVDRMSVAENVWLGREGWRTDLRAAAAVIGRIGADTGLELEPAAIAADLPISLRQRLEIVKALAREPRVLILDEPTSSLAPAEVDALFAALRRLRAAGISIILITHKLRDVAQLADRVTVLRRGRSVLTAAAAGTSMDAFARAMVGDDRASFPGFVHEPVTAGATLLSVTGPGIALAVAAGEIVGVAAVEGNGQRELLRGIAGFAPLNGSVTRSGAVAFIPEDRQGEGLILDFSLEENLALGRVSGWRLDRRNLRETSERVVTEFAIESGNPAAPVRRLSGGNQQKVVLARALASRPAVLVAENPTRGLDFQATREVHERLRRAAAEGCAILFHSPDLDEVLELAHRVAVMRSGRWIDVSASERTRERIGAMMLGAG